MRFTIFTTKNYILNVMFYCQLSATKIYVCNIFTIYRNLIIFSNKIDIDPKANKIDTLLVISSTPILKL